MAIDAQQLLLDHLVEIDRVIGFACRRNRLYGADADDFGSWAKLRLIENDYSIIRKFEGRCEFVNFIFVVIQRLLLDYRNHVLGRWRPSAEAKRLGATAVALEKLLHRDERSFDDATHILEREGVTPAELQALYRQLPQRDPRPREVAFEELKIDLEDSGRRRAAGSDASFLARSAAKTLRAAINALAENDRLVLRMRFEAQMSIPEIARVLQIEPKPLYRKIERNLAVLRIALERSGVNAVDVERIIESTSDELDFGLAVHANGVERAERDGM